MDLHAAAAAPKRRPYVHPRLVYLGTVRDLTLTGGVTTTDSRLATKKKGP